MSHRPQPAPITKRVPGTKWEVQLSPHFHGAVHGYRWGVRKLEVRDRPVKDDWRQVGSEVVYADETAARTAANELWTQLRNHARTTTPA